MDELLKYLNILQSETENNKTPETRVDRIQNYFQQLITYINKTYRQNITDDNISMFDRKQFIEWFSNNPNIIMSDQLTEWTHIGKKLCYGKIMLW